MANPLLVYPVIDLSTCFSSATANAATTNIAAPPAGTSKVPASASAPLAGTSTGGGADPPARRCDGRILEHCVLMKPGSNVEDVYLALKRPPYSLIDGDYIRAESRVVAQDTTAKGKIVGVENHEASASAPPATDTSKGAPAIQTPRITRGLVDRVVAATKVSVLKKTDVLDSTKSVIRIMTNKKSKWQHEARAAAVAAARMKT
mmetsp:Transcript_32802/g.45762  ORF Transcript_32802/g.45762 Transcript_32802/m.45762 type:complete len:204 (+) Transcript_32802:22-633(+)